MDNNKKEEEEKENQTLINNKEFKKNFECNICLETLSRACDLQKCGHTFCKFCIEQWLKTTEKCPTCNKQNTLNDIRENIPMQQLAKQYGNPREDMAKTFWEEDKKKNVELKGKEDEKVNTNWNMYFID